MSEIFNLSTAMTAAANSDGRREARAVYAVRDAIGNWAVITADVFDCPAAWLVCEQEVLELDADAASEILGMQTFASHWRKLQMDHESTMRILTAMSGISVSDQSAA